jgi:hypothetical protein
MTNAETIPGIRVNKIIGFSLVKRDKSLAWRNPFGGATGYAKFVYTLSLFNAVAVSRYHPSSYLGTPITPSTKTLIREAVSLR